MTSASEPGTDSSQYGLAREELSFYWENGYVGPFRALPSDEAEAIRDRLVLPLLAAGGGQAGRTGHCRHLDNRAVFELCALPAITGRLRTLLGDDLVLWRSHLWCKQPGDGEVPWHQDLTYWPLHPLTSISAWLALDPSTTENGCVQVLPGSHHVVLPTEPIIGDPLADRVRLDCADTSRAVEIQLDPGEFFLFSERLLHYSEPNHSTRRRLGLTIRVTVPFVKVLHDRIFPGHRNVVLCGTDSHRFNLIADPPVRA